MHIRDIELRRRDGNENVKKALFFFAIFARNYDVKLLRLPTFSFLVDVKERQRNFIFLNLNLDIVPTFDKLSG